MGNDFLDEMIWIKGNYGIGSACIYIDCGANNNENKNGISHVCEHFYIKMLKKKYLENVQDNKFACTGYTDYSFTIINVFYSENEANCRNLIDSMNISSFDFDLGYELYKKCIDEVLKECLIRDDEAKKSLMVNSLLTNGKIDYIPLGDAENVKKITYFDIVDYMRKNYDHIRCAFFHRDITDFHISYVNKSKKIKKKNEIFSYTRSYKVSNKSKCKVFWGLYDNSELFLLNLAIFEYVVLKKLDSKYGQNIYFMKKRLTNTMYYEILCLEGVEDERVYEIIEFIRNVSINEHEITIAKGEIINNLKENNSLDLNYAINNVINHFVYGETILVNGIEKIIQRVKRISLESVNQVTKYVFWSDFVAFIGY